MVLPHIGLVALLAVYTVAGATVFQLIELPHERRVIHSLIINMIYTDQIRSAYRANITTVRDRLKSKLWYTTLDNYTKISEQDFYRIADVRQS
jgi:hypothetical protein